MKRTFLGPFVQESRRMAHLALTMAFLQPAAAATMSGVARMNKLGGHSVGTLSACVTTSARASGTCSCHEYTL